MCNGDSLIVNLAAWCVFLSFHSAALPGAHLYDLAKVEESRARFADAIGLYQACTEADPALAPYARIRAAVCRTVAGDLEGGESLLTTIIEDAEEGPWKSLARHELARVRLDEGQSAQAEQLANKSITLAGSDGTLRAENWRLIGHARAQNGDHTGAQSAFNKAKEIVRQN